MAEKRDGLGVQWIPIVLVPLVVAVIGAAGSIFASRTSAVDEINRAKAVALAEVGQFPGEIRAFAGETCPVGWKECAGASLPREGQGHDQLYKAIGTKWGYHDSESFYVPDLRGVFLRGWNHEQEHDRLADPDVKGREAPDGETKHGATGDHVGSFQQAAVGPHQHGVPSSQGTSQGGDPPTAADTRRVTPTTAALPTTANTGSETRPKNVYVLYCIKDG